MSKGLEALKKLRYFDEHTLMKDNKFRIMSELNIIEEELKEYEQHEEILNDYGLTLVNFREACLLLAMLKGENLNIHDIAKQLKAFEIIKEHILYCENVDCFVFVNVTKEVNELLKEVLL